MYTKAVITSLLFIAISFCSCDSVPGKKEKFKNPTGYNLQRPYKISLPLELDEISGIIFHEQDTSIFAINDEKGWLYKIYPDHPQRTEKWKFFGGEDFEDLYIIDSNFYALRSNGNIIEFKFRNNGTVNVQTNTFPFGESEFESIYYDTSIRKLMIICKDCESDKKKALSIFTFDPLTNEYGNAPFSIDVKKAAKFVGQKSMKFKPSAAALHPITGNLYVISSINKLLMVTNPHGELVEAVKIDKGLFKQPEGICFTPSGTMIISNEAAGIGLANLLIFKYQPSQQ
jgi:uncharacterized protein YjiK